MDYSHADRAARARRYVENHQEYLNHSYGMWRGGMIANLRNGARLTLRNPVWSSVSDFEIFDEVVLRDAYRINSVVSPGDLVFDIGAHIGCFSILAAQAGARKVISLEPERENFQRLRANCSLNPSAAVMPIQAAVGSPGGRLQLSLNNCGAHRLVDEDHACVRRVQTNVLVLSPENLLEMAGADRIGVLKVDCEGCETRVLSCRRLLQRSDTVVGELHDFPGEKPMVEVLAARLREAGFFTKVLTSHSESRGGFRLTFIAKRN